MMRPTERLVVAGGVSTFLGALTMLPITQDRGYLGWSLGLIILLGLGASAIRRTSAGQTGALASHLVILLGYLLVLSRVLPRQDPDRNGLFEVLGDLSTSAFGHLQGQSAPMTAHPGVLWWMVAAVGVAMVMTDLLVCGLQRHVWGLAPTLTLFLIPALSLRADLSIIGGLAVTLGYLGILLAEGMNRADRWRRGVLEDREHPIRSVAPVLWGSAALITVPALVLTMIAWLAVPTGAAGLLGGGQGPGNGGPLQLSDPTLDLRRNLNRPEDAPVLRYTTEGGSDNRGVYLRLASLPRIDLNGWQNAPIQVLQGQPGPIPGVSAEPQQRRTTQVRIGEFDSEYLPLPYAARRLDVPGQWGYDPQSLIYIATGDNRGEATRGLEYTVESADLVPNGERLSVAQAGRPADYQLTGPIPEGLPQEIIDLTGQITADQPTPALKAAAIQSYLRSGEFEYSTVPAPGTGYLALTNFLFRDKRGYCEQFAAAMAVMARAAGIPSRVAIGFLPGEQIADGEWEVTSHDLHAWPELYFDGMGWVRWEPTPGNGTSPPAWTVARAGGVEETSTPTSSATGQERETAPASTTPTAPTESTATAPTGSETGPGTWGWRALLVAIGAAVVLVALMLLPGLARLRRRQVRLSGQGPPPTRIEGAWDELRDTVIDHRGTWPAGSPRAIGRQLSRSLSPEDAAEVGQLALLVERSRYSRSISDSDGIGQVEHLVTRLRHAVAGPASRGQRLWARLWPRSLWQGSGRTGKRGL